MREAVRRAEGHKVVLEASGNATLDRVRAMAETGVDVISVGALTHSSPSVDLSLLIDSPVARRQALCSHHSGERKKRPPFQYLCIIVIPAQAESSGEYSLTCYFLDSRLRGNDGVL